MDSRLAGNPIGSGFKTVKQEALPDWSGLFLPLALVLPGQSYPDALGRVLEKVPYTAIQNNAFDSAGDKAMSTPFFPIQVRFIKSLV